MAGLLLGASKHIVDEWTIDVGAAEADCVEKQFVIRNEVSGIRQLVGHNLVVTDLAQHHQSSRNRNGFSSSTAGHRTLDRSFLPRHPKILSFEINSAIGTFVEALARWKLNFIPFDSTSADMVKPSARIFVIQRIGFVNQHHASYLS